MENKDLKICFFGTDEFSIFVLEELLKADFKPELIVTAPDRPKGRKLELTPPPVKVWADENNINTLQPEKLDDDFVSKVSDFDLFIVASYGIIMPQKVLDLPKYQTLNVHPSLLPLYRGASPIESAILNDDRNTGVTIMRMDNKMDHGPIVDQEFVSFEEWPDKMEVLEILAKKGGELLAQLIPEWVDGNIDEQEQDDEMATYTKLIKKSDGEIDLSDDDRKNFLKYKAYKPWPGIFFFKENPNNPSTPLRVKITEAEFTPARRPEPCRVLRDDSGSKTGKFEIKKIIPEGKKEQEYKG